MGEITTIAHAGQFVALKQGFHDGFAVCQFLAQPADMAADERKPEQHYGEYPPA
jgi:hypothetical protein